MTQTPYEEEHVSSNPVMLSTAELVERARGLAESGERRLLGITGAPGTGFLHALHLLLDVGPTARLLVPGAPAVRVLDSDRPDRHWPDGLDRLGPDDGTAVCALLPGTSIATVVDGRHALRLGWQSSDQPEQTSLLLWRNLRGWPAANAYRSIGIEPMLGRAADRSTAAAHELAGVGPAGRTGWTLRLEALTR